MTPVVVVTGVAGAGKTTIAEALAARLGWDVVDGDALHSPENIAKMASGRPLDDADRMPWLHRIRAWVAHQQDTGRPGVVTCSALRRSYRDLLRGPGVHLVLLSVPTAELAARLRERTGHFMSADMLASQLTTFEAPGTDEDVLVVDASAPPAVVVDGIVAALDLLSWQAG